MSIIAEDFSYNEKRLTTNFSTEYMIVDLDNQSRLQASSRTVQNSMLTNDSPLTYFYGTVGSNVVTFDIAICRKDGKNLSVNNCKELSNWLMGCPIPKPINFYLCDHGVLEDTTFIGLFITYSYIQSGNEQKQGMVFTFQNISPYGFTPEYRYSLSDNKPTCTIIPAGSQTGEVIYPTIVIVPNGTNTVTINNTSDTSVGALSIQTQSGVPIMIEDRNLYTAYSEYDSVNKRTNYYKNGLYSFSHLNNFNWPCILDSKYNYFRMTGSANIIIITRFYKNLLY